jgi:hypothetical protein
MTKKAQIWAGMHTNERNMVCRVRQLLKGSGSCYKSTVQRPDIFSVILWNMNAELDSSRNNQR